MENRILYVYFGVDRLPYKDPECQVHFPNVGSVINGASNVDTIIFDVSKIGGTNGYQYVSVVTLPSGTKLYKTLSGSNNQVSLSISQEYTTQSGDLTIALNSYQGGSEIVVDEDTGLISVEGSPIIVATGSIKLSVAYTPTMESDYNPVSDITVQEALALVGSKASLDYVKFGRAKKELEVNALPIVDYHGIDLDTYEPTSEEDTTQLFENGLPIGIYSATQGSFLMTGAPTLYHDDNGVANRICAIYRNTSNEANDNLSITYLFLMLSPNNKFYFISTFNTYVFGDEYASKNTVEHLIKQYGTNGNILNIGSFPIGSPITLTASQVAQINRQDCVINSNGNLYHRYNEDTTTITFSKTAELRDVAQGKTIYLLYLTFTKATNELAASRKLIQITYPINIGSSLRLTSDYRIQLLDPSGLVRSSIDLPLESVVVGGSYDDTTETIILTLQNGSTIDIPVHDLVEGLATTTQLESGLDTKVDKVQGKGLSTNDFTDADKTKVDNSATTSELTSGLATKQDTLVSGTNIKTINNENILGSGNITIQGGGGTWGSITGDIQDQTDLQNELQDIREVAEGKTQSFSLSYLDTVAVVQAYLTANPDKKIVDESGNDITSDFLANEYSGIIDNSIFNSQNASLTPTSPTYLLCESSTNVPYDSDISYVLVEVAKIKTGDIILVVETDVPDRWYRISDGSFLKLEVALSNYVDLTTAQTITGVKTFNSQVNVSTINGTSQVVYTINNSTKYVVSNSDITTRIPIKPSSGYESVDFGSTTQKWKDAYFSGQVYAQNTFNVINASDIISNTLTQEQYDLITNGKPTLTIGTTTVGGNALQPGTLFTTPTLVSGYYYGLVVSTLTNAKTIIYQYYIDGNKKIYLSNFNNIRVFGIDQVNGKQFPTYPATNASPQVPTIAPNGGALSWETHMHEWYGTQAEYDALSSYDSNTIYNILES